MKHYSKLLLTAVAVIAALCMLVSCAAPAATSSAVASTPAAATQAPASSSAAAPSAEAAQSISVTDMASRTVELDAPAQKVVALMPADCEILFELGAGSLLAGRGEYCNYPAEVSDIPAVDSGSEMNLEQIIALEPQLVIMSSMAQNEEQVAALESAGIKVAVSDAQNIEGVYTAITMIGALTGKDAEAAALITEMKDDFAETAAKVKAASDKTIYFEVSPLQYGLWAAGSGTFMDELASMIGLKNAFSDVSGWAEVSEEQVIERDPDYIVTITMYSGEGQKPDEEILARSGWSKMKAVSGKKVFTADSDELSRPGPRLTDGLKNLYEFVYGED